MLPSQNQPGLYRMTAAGLCASLLGIGLARFAYTPLFTGLIAAKWFDPDQAAWIGAANLGGYLAGALLAQPLARRMPACAALRAAMLLAAAAFFACASPFGFVWFSLWRFGSGVAGGVIMVLAAPAILPHVPPDRRGLASGAIFVGVGAGIVASGTLVPALLRWGLTEAWIGLGILALALTAIAWFGWPATNAVAEDTPAPHARFGTAFWLLCLGYGLNAFGLVPHMVFLVDFVARFLGQGLAAGAHYWVLFGAGAVIGPLLAGAAADRIGFAPALRLAFLLQAAAIALPAISTAPLALAISSVVVGAFVPGVAPLALGRVQEIAAPALRKTAWSWCTAAFAIGQSAGAYGMTALFVRSDHVYGLLFGLGALALTVAFVIDTAPDMIRSRDIRITELQ